MGSCENCRRDATDVGKRRRRAAKAAASNPIVLTSGVVAASTKGRGESRGVRHTQNSILTCGEVKVSRALFTDITTVQFCPTWIEHTAW